MKERKYLTELKKEEFLSKLEKYSIFNFTSMSVIGKLKNGKGIIECGGRGTKKFSIDFINENQIQVKSHVSILDIIFGILSIIALIGMIIVFIVGEFKAGITCSIGTILILGCLILSQILPWNKVEKSLLKDFLCSRIN